MDTSETVTVPLLIGLDVREAHERAFVARLVAVTADPARPLPLSGVVTAQLPAPGTRVPPTDAVAIVVEGGPGGGGGGQPLAPPPTPLDPSGTK